MLPSGTPQSSGGTRAPADAALLEEVLEVLRSVASLRAPDRAMAVRYHSARAAILASSLQGFVPPYLLQCVSVFKFHEFINLFAPDVARRVDFIEQTFDGCRKALGFVRRYDVFADGD